MRIAIVDDLKSDNNKLKSTIKKYFNDSNEKVDIDCYYDGESFLRYFSEGKYDIAFIDIYMKEISGIDTARKIFSSDKNCKIIFSTESNNFASESYEVKAYSYIIKPISSDKINSIFNNIKYKESKDSLNVSLISYKTNINIALNSILYIDIVTRNVNIHLFNDTFPVKGKFVDYSSKLLKYPSFIECFRGVLINMEHIANVTENDFILDNGEVIPIRKRHKLDIKKCYLKYKLNVGEI